MVRTKPSTIAAAGLNREIRRMAQARRMTEEPSTRAGTVALVGFPNVGKSSLMNRMVEQKLSIVTPLAQTTRQRVLGIDTRDGVQMVFVDTPAWWTRATCCTAP